MAMRARTKSGGLLETLRRDIVEGIYKPGHQLPTRSEITDRYGVGYSTVQKALDSLREAGFVRSRAGMGTFVVDLPPHLCNYAVSMAQSGQWSCFFDSLREAIRSVDLGDDVEFREYITSRDVAARQGVNDLSRDVSNRNLAGVIISGDPADLKGTGIFENPAVPCVANQSGFDVPCPRVHMRDESFLDRATEFLVSRGRRRIAHLFMDFEAHQEADFEDHMRRLNVEVKPYWVQSVAMSALFRSVTNVVHLLVQAEMEGQRPDALIIHDDNLVEHAVAGLLAAGVRVPEDLDVVVKFNYPTRSPSLLPITRLGLDLRELLKKCVESLDAQRKGEPVPNVTTMEALFEHEIEK